MNIMVVLWPVLITATGGFIVINTFFFIQSLLVERTPPIPIAVAIITAIMVGILYFILAWQITHIKVRRVLCYKKSFWGVKLCRGYSYWRIGLGRGFLEIGGSCAGLYLPSGDAIEGKPRAIDAKELLEHQSNREQK